MDKEKCQNKNSEKQKNKYMCKQKLCRITIESKAAKKLQQFQTAFAFLLKIKV